MNISRGSAEDNMH